MDSENTQDLPEAKGVAYYALLGFKGDGSTLDALSTRSCVLTSVAYRNAFSFVSRRLWYDEYLTQAKRKFHARGFLASDMGRALLAEVEVTYHQSYCYWPDYCCLVEWSSEESTE